MLRTSLRLFNSSVPVRKLTDETLPAITKIQELTKKDELDKALGSITEMERRYPRCSVAANSLRSKIYAIRELKSISEAQNINPR